MNDFNQLLDEPKFTIYELHEKIPQLRPGKLRALFIDEPGVIRIGHDRTRGKRPHYRLLIPQSVVERVLRRMQVATR